MKVKIEVKLKRGHFDPEGDATAKSLRELGFPAGEVKVSKVYVVDIELKDKEKALEAAGEMCRKLLANPTKDDFLVELQAGAGADSTKVRL